ncbi:hypothetical protein SPF06_19900 [Sinomonas sp. JGH33]|uniref:Uncharacterized protein n=1 Tax=Sinomonas terricola TaxID=3110330 RepID=A0ABU5TBC0_9MICC|nr:hypothetical protein [Sinomonas sp. JGH33]MEA5456993.1 hypothetical protein [Sinomonas sp. JGH33]
MANEEHRPNVVLLTAAVSPTTSGKIAVRDPAIRLRQYQGAIARWASALHGSLFRLVVVETTGEPAEKLLAGLGKTESSRVRVLDYSPTPQELARGKGAVEIASIRHVIAQEMLDANSTLFKCTGRLVVVNARRIIEPLGDSVVRSRMTADRSWVDTRFIGAVVGTWTEQLFRDIDLVDDDAGRYLERVMAARLSYESAINGVRLERFHERPLFEGVSGTHGARYSSSAASIRDRLFRPVESVLGAVAARKQI